jgi:hypothetical protein
MALENLIYRCRYGLGKPDLPLTLRLGKPDLPLSLRLGKPDLPLSL